MKFSLWTLAAVVLSATMLKVCNSQSVLQWKVMLNGNQTEIYFDEDHFNKFYSCLFGDSSKMCQVSRSSMNFWTFTASINSVSPSNITRYLCSQNNNVTYPAITCTKVNSMANEICTITTKCTKHVVDEDLLNITGKLPFIEISTAQNLSFISLTYNATPSPVTITPCAQGCSFETNPPPDTEQPTTVQHFTENINSSTVSSSSSSSTGLTTELGVIIGLAIGLAALLVALIILGVIVWKRRQKPRDNILSNDVTAYTFTNHNNGIVNSGGNCASADDMKHPYTCSTSKPSTAPEMGTKDTKNQYETVDLDPDPEQGILTKASIKSKNESSIKSSDSKKRALPAVLESPYSEPETTHVTGPYSTVDLDDAVGNVTITSDKLESTSSPKLPETRSQDTPSPSENPYSEPENKNMNDPYTRINPNTKSQMKKSTADSPDMEEAGHGISNPPIKVTEGAEGNVSVSATPGDENDVRNYDSENAYSKLHETQRHFQNPYSVLSDPFTDTLDEPPANLQSSNVDITPETATSTPAMDLPVHKDVVSDNGDKAIDDDDDAISEPDQSECDSDKNDENRKPDVAMHDSDNEEIKVQTDKDILDYTGPAENKTSASISSPTETGTAKKNEYFQLESDTESSTEEEEGD